jgi:hypothetical protein
MPAVAFDTLKFVEKLETGGFSHTQAKAAAEAFADATGEQLATKSDLREGLAALKADLRAEIAPIKAEQLLLKWMTGFNLAMTVAILFLLLRH